MGESGNSQAGMAGASTLDAMLDVDHPRKGAAAQWARATFASHGNRFDRDVWEAAAAFGVQRLLVPPTYGGIGGSAVDALLTFEGLACGAREDGFVFALASQVLAMQRALSAFGTDAQRTRWLPGLCDGSLIGAFAMSEADAGSDIAAITTTAAARDDGSYVLSGTKSWVTLGPVCDVAIVFASTAPDLGRWGITAFLVDTSLPGVRRSAPVEKMGMTACPFGSIFFDECVVGPDALLGVVGAGGNIFTEAVEGERAFLFAVQLGSMERLLATTVERARTRRAFGQTIGSYQAVSHRIVEMKLRHETSRLLVYKAAGLYDRGAAITLAASLAKLQTSEMAVLSALDAVRLHGAEGYTIAGGVEADLRDAVGGLAYSGTSDIQRNIVARLLGVDRPPRRDRGRDRAEPGT